MSSIPLVPALVPAIVAFDFETTGLDPRCASPIQLCMLVASASLEEIDVLTFKIKPLFPVPAEVAAINGYDPDVWEREALDVDTADDIFSRWILQFFPSPDKKPRGLVHASTSKPNPESLKFDFKFMQRYLPKTYALLHEDHLCSCYAFKNWRDTHGKWEPVFDSEKGKMVKPNCKLATLAQMAGFPTDNMHDAFFDVRATLAGMRFLMRNVKYGEAPSAKLPDEADDR